MKKIKSKLKKIREESKKRRQFYKEEYEKAKKAALEKARKRNRQQIRSKAYKAAHQKYDVTSSERVEHRRKKFADISKNIGSGGLGGFGVNIPDFDYLMDGSPPKKKSKKRKTKSKKKKKGGKING